MSPEDVPAELLMLARRKAFQADPGRYPSPGNADADAGMAAALAVVLPEVQAQTLREVADRLDGFVGPGGSSAPYDKAGRDIVRLIREDAARLTETTEEPTDG